ncbi:MAG TPA: glycosyltransferase [Thermoanaerobaculia bacterium]|nr:glycosyltransferase [Thermoanaerobaculia bacterium]
MKTISVIMPSYNYARYLRQAIDSALGQTCAPLEVIVVDDGSTDATPEVLASYGDRIHVIRQKNQGVATARNTGIAAARGEYVAFLDSDDLWDPRKLELQVARFEADPSLGLAHSGVEMFDDAGNTLRVYREGKEGRIAADLLCFSPNVITLTGSNIMVPKRVAEEIGGFDPRLPPSEDWDFCYRVAARYPVGFVADVLVRYRIHSTAAHRNIGRIETAMRLAFEKTFASADPTVQALRRHAYGSLHRVLAGSYFQARQPRSFLRNLVASLRYDPRNIGYFAAWPLRVISRRLARSAA